MLKSCVLQNQVAIIVFAIGFWFTILSKSITSFPYASLNTFF